MTRDDVIRMARDAGYSGFDSKDDRLHLFASLIGSSAAAAEREACAKVCELIAREIDDTNGLATYCAKAIRARGEKV